MKVLMPNEYQTKCVFWKGFSYIYFLNLTHMSDNSVTLHRVIKANPEKVFRALTEKDALTFWNPPYGYLCQIHEMEVKPGGKYRMTFINFTTGKGESFSGEYIEIKVNEFLKQKDKFDDPNLPGEMTTSIWLKKVSCGTEIKVIQEGIPSVIPLELCYLGWQDSLDKLIRLVEPEINN